MFVFNGDSECLCRTAVMCRKMGCDDPNKQLYRNLLGGGGGGGQMALKFFFLPKKIFFLAAEFKMGQIKLGREYICILRAGSNQSSPSL